MPYVGRNLSSAVLARLKSRATYRGPADPWARAILAGSLTIGAALRLWMTFNDDGIYWPDEIYQTLEPAHRLAFGYGLIAWEYVDGLRNWTLPALIAALLTMCQWLGLDDPRQYLIAVRLVFVAGSLVCGAGVYLLARSYGARREAAAVGAALSVLFAPTIYFSTRALFEGASTPLAVLGFALAVAPTAGRRQTITGAGLVGLAVIFRLQCGVFALALIGILIARRAFTRAAAAGMTLAALALVYGLVDRLTWADAPNAYFNGWFHSALKYLEFNVVQGRGSEWGTSPWSYYFTTLFNLAPVLMALATLTTVAALRRAPGLWAATAVFVAVHAAVAHKELRFVLPVLPFLFALTAIGLDRLPALAGRAAAAVLISASLVSAARFHTLTAGDLGQHSDQEHLSAYDNPGSLNRLLFAARDRPTLCGLSIYGPPVVGTGGYSYLHRRVPLYSYDAAHITEHLVNFIIAPADRNLPGTVVARDGDWVLRDLAILPCRRPAPFSWRL